MIRIEISEDERYDNEKEEFVKIKRTILKLEHSLIAVRKWEAKWHKPFLGSEDKTIEEIIDYTRCMCLNIESVDLNVFLFLSQQNIEEIVAYIQNPMTATWFSNNVIVGASRRNDEIVTAEIIYYWMIELNIPVEFEKWHLKQLLTLIKVVNLKRGGDKKMSKKDAADLRRRLNAERRAKYKTKG